MEVVPIIDLVSVGEGLGRRDKVEKTIRGYKGLVRTIVKLLKKHYSSLQMDPFVRDENNEIMLHPVCNIPRLKMPISMTTGVEIFSLLSIST